MISSILRRLLHNPYRDARRNNVTLGNSILIKSFRINAACKPGLNNITIGDDCILGCEICFETTGATVSIGNGTFCNSGARLIASTSIEIGSWVTIAWGVTIYDHDSHSLDHLDRVSDQKKQLRDFSSGDFIRNKDWTHVRRAPIRIEDHAWIGFDAVILKGVCIGRGAVVGARSVVTHDVEPFTVVAGNPARLIKRLPTASACES